MNKKKIIIISSIIVILVITIIGFMIILNKRGKKDLDLDSVSNEEIEELTEETVEEKEDEDELLNISEIVFLDKSESISENEKDAFIEAVSNETDRYMKLIFNYSEYSDEYKNNLLKGMADTEKYPLTKYYYVDTIVDSFAENQVKCSTNNVTILGVTIVNLTEDGTYDVVVRGYIDLYFSAKNITEDKRYIVFEDDLCKENDNITHFDSKFNYVLRQDDFSYGLVDDGTNTIRFNGKPVFEFDLEQYNPEYKQSLEIEEEYEKQLKEDEERLSTDTDSEED